MEYEDFLRIVEQRAHLDGEAAERAVRAVLEVLGDRLSQGQARDLLEQLPAPMKPWVYTETGAQGYDYEGFLRRVAEREGTDPETAERHARAVFYALGRAVTDDEIRDLAADLPQDYAPVVSEATGEYLEIMPADEFYLRVAERAGLDVDEAPHVTDAVLTTLAERIAGGDVDDLLGHLPLRLRAPLRRGREQGDGQARRMSRDEFLQRVAAHEGVPFSGAVEQLIPHTRAVLATLREAVSAEFFDVRAQLPPDYGPLLVGPTAT